MREQIKKETKVVETKVYVAIDGTEFDNADKCKEWEKSLECMVNAGWKKIPKSCICEESFLWGGCCDDYIYIIKPRSLDDIKIINMYTELSEDEALTQDDIDKEVTLELSYGSEWYRSKGGVEQIIKDVQNGIDKLHHNLENYGIYVAKSEGESVEDITEDDAREELFRKFRRNNCDKDIVIELYKDGEKYKEEKWHINVKNYYY